MSVGVGFGSSVGSGVFAFSDAGSDVVADVIAAVGIDVGSAIVVAAGTSAGAFVGAGAALLDCSSLAGSTLAPHAISTVAKTPSMAISRYFLLLAAAAALPLP